MNDMCIAVLGDFYWSLLVSHSSLLQTSAVDVFAFGLVAYFVLSKGHHPFYREPESFDGENSHFNVLFTSFDKVHSIQKAINDRLAPPIVDKLITDDSADERKPDRSKSACLICALFFVQCFLVHTPSCCYRHPGASTN